MLEPVAVPREAMRGVRHVTENQAGECRRFAIYTIDHAFTSSESGLYAHEAKLVNRPIWICGKLVGESGKGLNQMGIGHSARKAGFGVLVGFWLVLFALAAIVAAMFVVAFVLGFTGALISNWKWFAIGGGLLAAAMVWEGVSARVRGRT